MSLTKDQSGTRRYLRLPFAKSEWQFKIICCTRAGFIGQASVIGSLISNSGNGGLLKWGVFVVKKSQRVVGWNHDFHIPKPFRYFRECVTNHFVNRFWHTKPTTLGRPIWA